MKIWTKALGFVLVAAATFGVTQMNVSAEENAVFVATTGSDSAAGDISAPLASLQAAVDRVVASGGAISTIYIREGEYYPVDSVVIEGLKGSAENPITITNYEDEAVTFYGTVDVPSNWTKTAGMDNVYEVEMDRDVWQLFRDEKMVTTARFPNASWEQDDDIGYIFNVLESTRHLSSAKDADGKFISSFGHFYDANQTGVTADGEDEGSHVAYGYARPGINDVGIADLGYSLEGANVVLHMGSWLSWANEVTEHEVGSDNFKFNTDFSGSGTSMANNAKTWAGKDGKGSNNWIHKNLTMEQGNYFFEGLMCLDHEDEWYFDKDSKKIYVYSEDGPPTEEFSAKAQSYLLDMSDCAYITVAGIDYFGTTLKATDSNHITIENSEFLYPSYNKLVLDIYERPEVLNMLVTPAILLENPAIETHNTVRNCEFAYMDGPVLEMSGRYNVVENNLMHHIDYTNIGTGAEGTVNLINSDYAVFHNNTVHTAGNSEGIRAGKSASIMYNDLSNMSLIQHDGSLINIGASVQDGVQIRYNWIHDAPKSSMRFDSANMGNAATVKYDKNGTMANNVTWNVGQVKVKGAEHYVIGNTIIDSNAAEAIGITVLDDHKMGGFNENTWIYNNAGILSDHFSKIEPLNTATLMSNNYDGDPATLLRDPENLDFRPTGELRGKAKRIDANSVGENALPFIDPAYAGDVHIGAYHMDSDSYWIPGYMDEQATVPIVSQGYEVGRADLMWKEAYGATENVVYFGADASSMSEVARQSNNIYVAEGLVAGKSYAWRVDSIVDDEVVEGSVWTFVAE